MTIVIRVDSSTEIGSGHLMRCLRLATFLKQQEIPVVFIARDLPGNINERVVQAGIELKRLTRSPDGANNSAEIKHAYWLGVTWQADAEETLVLLRGIEPIWLVVDHYALDKRWEEQIRNAFPTMKMLVIDDIADREHCCDILLDQNLFTSNQESRYDQRVPAQCELLLGPTYALLDPIYGSMHQVATNRPLGEPPHLLVYFGAADLAGMTLKVVETLKNGNYDTITRISVIIGKHHRDFSTVAAAAQDGSIRIFDFIDKFPEFLGDVDLMIGAGGSTSWERAALGIPAILYALADNQVGVSRSLSEYGIVSYLGLSSEFDGAKLTEALSTMLGNKNLFLQLRHKNLQICDGRGLERVVTAMKRLKAL